MKKEESLKNMKMLQKHKKNAMNAEIIKIVLNLRCKMIKNLVFEEVVKADYSFQLATGISRNFSIEKNEKTGRFDCDYKYFDTFQDAVNYCNKMNYETFLMKIKEVEEMKSKWEVK